MFGYVIENCTHMSCQELSSGHCRSMYIYLEDKSNHARYFTSDVVLVKFKAVLPKCDRECTPINVG